MNEETSLDLTIEESEPRSLVSSNVTETKADDE